MEDQSNPPESDGSDENDILEKYSTKYTSLKLMAKLSWIYLGGRP